MFDSVWRLPSLLAQHVIGSFRYCACWRCLLQWNVKRRQQQYSYGTTHPKTNSFLDNIGRIDAYDRESVFSAYLYMWFSNFHLQLSNQRNLTYESLWLSFNAVWHISTLIITENVWWTDHIEDILTYRDRTFFQILLDQLFLDTCYLIVQVPLISIEINNNLKNIVLNWSIKGMSFMLLCKSCNKDSVCLLFVKSLIF